MLSETVTFRECDYWMIYYRDHGQSVLGSTLQIILWVAHEYEHEVMSMNILPKFIPLCISLNRALCVFRYIVNFTQHISYYSGYMVSLCEHYFNTLSTDHKINFYFYYQKLSKKHYYNYHFIYVNFFIDTKNDTHL